MFVDNSEELAQNKLLLLYIIDKSPKPLTNAEITEFVLDNNYMNFFLVQQFLSELVETNFLKYSDENEKNYYILLNKGKLTLDYFDNRIPKDIKDDIDKKLKIKKIEIMREKQIRGSYIKKNDKEYVVTLKLVEGDTTLFNIDLNVANINQAKLICDNWKKNPDSIYQDILDSIIKLR